MSDKERRKNYSEMDRVKKSMKELKINEEPAVFHSEPSEEGCAGAGAEHGGGKARQLSVGLAARSEVDQSLEASSSVQGEFLEEVIIENILGIENFPANLREAIQSYETHNICAPAMEVDGSRSHVVSANVASCQPNMATAPFQSSLVTTPFQPSLDANLFLPPLETAPLLPYLGTSLLQSSLETAPLKPFLAASPFQPSLVTTPFQPLLATTPFQSPLDGSSFQPSLDTAPFKPHLDASQFQTSLVPAPFQTSMATAQLKPFLDAAAMFQKILRAADEVPVPLSVLNDVMFRAEPYPSAIPVGQYISPESSDDETLTEGSDDVSDSDESDVTFGSSDKSCAMECSEEY